MLLFLLLWYRQATKSALVVLFVAFLFRENTLLACLALIFVAWQRRDYILLSAGSGILLAGMIITGRFAKLGLPNRHHLPDFLYLLGKVPYYTLYNLIGLRIWTNARPDEGTPWITWALPHWLHLGSDSIIGLCPIYLNCPIFTVACMLTIFGTGPLLLIWAWRQQAKFSQMPTAIYFCFIYGLGSFLVGPLLGDWVARLVCYGFPLFWIALPYWANQEPGLRLKSRPQAFILILCFTLASWWPVISRFRVRDETHWLGMGFIFFYAITWWCLNRSQSVEKKREAGV